MSHASNAPNPESKLGGSRQTILICAVLAIATPAVYWQVREFDFTNFDDVFYVSHNPHVTGGLRAEEVVWALTAHRCNNWHPLTWISHMVDCQIGELDPGVHHLHSLLLHVASVLLLFFVLERMTGHKWRSALVAAVFALHPMHVESVAWVAERKDVLSTFFWMLTMLAYCQFVRRRGPARYILLLLLYVLGLLSKPMLVSLPVILLILDFWPLRRPMDGETGRSIVVEKLPLLALALASCIVTFIVQKTTGAVATLDAYSVGIRLANAVVGAVEYLIKTVWPVGLACYYPHPGTGIPVWQTLASAALLVVVTALVVRARRKRPYLLAGWLWYLITLIPVIGIVQVGKQATADRYTYVPMIGILIALVWALGDLLQRRIERSAAVRVLVAIASLAVLLALSVVAYRQVGYWRNDVSIWTRALAVTTNNAVAHFNLGTTLATQGDEEGAMDHFRKAIQADPRKYEAYANLGAMHAMRGEDVEAERYLLASIKIKPNNRDPRRNLGMLLLQQGKLREAIPHLRVAVELRPDDYEAKEALDSAMEQTQGD